MASDTITPSFEAAHILIGGCVISTAVKTHDSLNEQLFKFILVTQIIQE